MKTCLILILLWGRVIAADMDLSGTWLGSLPGENGATPFVLILEQAGPNEVSGSYFSLEHQGGLKARLQDGLLEAAIDFGGGVVFKGKLTVSDSAISGNINSEALKMDLPIELHRSTVAGVAALGIETVDLSISRPGKVYRNELPETLKEPIAKRIERHLEENGIVGLATAVLYEGRIADLRTYGWQDFAGRVAVSTKTMFRWASIAKSLTATATMQLVEAGKLDLDRDVRDYVPELPAKPWPITSRQLLAHHAGMVHYHPGKVIVTEREYDVLHPFSDRILALDKFKESALLFEPGARFSYSTPGYALLGAVIQRAGGAIYEDQVRKRILETLGMTSMRPDYPHVAIPNRSLGYKRVMNEWTIASGDSDVSWKLAAGGWISNITDLARFAEGVLKRDLVSEPTWEDMWKPRSAADGKPGFYGYGFNIKNKEGTRIVFHSGAQRKTQTMLMLCPDLGLGLAVMSNTEGVRHEDLSLDLIEILMAR